MGRVFSEEYKKDAVGMVLEHGISASKVSKDLGIGRSTLDNWLRMYRSSTANEVCSIGEYFLWIKLGSDVRTI